MVESVDTRHAYVEDAEDSCSSLGNATTRQYAGAPSTPKANTGKSRADKKSPRKTEESVASPSPPASESTSPSVERRKKSSKAPERSERERERAKEAKRQLRRQAKEDEEDAYRRAKAEQREQRALRKAQSNTSTPNGQPPLVSQGESRRAYNDDPAYYGVMQPGMGGRPRAQTSRPASYYAGQSVHPPIANMAWHHAHGISAGGSFPPPRPGYGGPPMGSPMGPYAPPPGQQGYFDTAMSQQRPEHLKERFNLARPSSASGYRGQPPPPHHDERELERAQRPARRPSHNKKQSEDRKRMPPPEMIPSRSQSAAIVNGPFRPPPQPLQRQATRQARQSTSHRRSVNFAEQSPYEDEDFRGSHDLFHDMSPDPNDTTRRTTMTRRRKSGVFDNEFDASPSRNRDNRSSSYGAGALDALGSSYEDKYRDAQKYQDDISGGPQYALTADALRRANKSRAVESSRSTRSSGSRDESEYRRSTNGTGITRSSSGNKEDVTIKLTGAAVVRVPGAEIECVPGGEITLTTRPSGSRSGSDQASTVYQHQIEDSRSRVDRSERRALPMRSRAPSQSDSQSRRGGSMYAPYDPSFAPSGFI